MLVRDAKEGDVAAFEELVRRHTGRVFRIALHITKCQEDAEEVVQDVFVKAFTRLHDFEERAMFSTWLTRIAINTALMKVRGRSRYRTVSLSQDEHSDADVGSEQIVDWRPDPEQLYTRSELKQILISVLDSLPDHYRIIFVLRDIEGFSIVETAELLDLSSTAVRARLHRARLQLRERLNAHFQRYAKHARASAHTQSLLVKLTSPFEEGLKLWMEVGAARTANEGLPAQTRMTGRDRGCSHHCDTASTTWLSTLRFMKLVSRGLPLEPVAVLPGKVRNASRSTVALPFEAR